MLALKFLSVCNVRNWITYFIDILFLSSYNIHDNILSCFNMFSFPSQLKLKIGKERCL